MSNTLNVLHFKQRVNKLQFLKRNNPIVDRFNSS